MCRSNCCLTILLAGAMFMMASSADRVCAADVILNERGIPEWDLPQTAGENWRFYPIEWTVQPLFDGRYDDFELTTTITIGDYIFAETVFDTAQYMRYMSMAQFHFQGGMVLRYHDAGKHYRLQFSVKEKSVALWKTPGNFLAVADCPIAKGKPFKVTVRAQGARIVVSVDGRQLIDVTDNVEPISAGAILAGANHGRVSFADNRIQTIENPEAPDVGGPHQPDFSVKRWCGYRWVFDGDEPIARLGDGKDGKAWNWHQVALYSVKLRPGTRAADFIPLQFRGAGNWPDKPMEIVALTPERVTLRAYTSTREEDKPADAATVCDVTITYDLERDAYVYEMDATLTYLKDRSPIIEIMDPWPYGVSGPAHNLAKPWDSRYNIVLWRATDGKLYRAPLNHFVRPQTMELNHERPMFGFFGESDVNPVYEILGPSLRSHYRFGCCTVLLDWHTQRIDNRSRVKAGTKERDRWRVTSYHDERVADMIKDAGWHEDWQRQLGGKAALFHPSGTTFFADQVVEVVEHSRAQGFEPWPYYTIDDSVGRTDKSSLRMDAGQGKYYVAVREGLSYFGQSFDGGEMTLELYVKTQDLDGTFTVEITKPLKLASRAFSATTPGWERIRLKLAPKPSDPWVEIHFVVNAEKGKKGSAWIDDVSFLPSQ